MSSVDGRRLRRVEGQRLLDALAMEYLDRTEVRQASMFGSRGLRVNEKFFAFIGDDGRLIVNLPPPQAAALVRKGEATHVRAGRSITREWVGVPIPAHDQPEPWRALLADAYRYVESLTTAAR